MQVKSLPAVAEEEASRNDLWCVSAQADGASLPVRSTLHLGTGEVLLMSPSGGPAAAGVTHLKGLLQRRSVVPAAPQVCVYMGLTDRCRSNVVVLSVQGRLKLDVDLEAPLSLSC